ncbi:MAG: catecholate siderophore receptor Fiu [Gammaproteobacteria bacterium]|nr:MAG: catecholate siderophore receptor Fiu [Gammaproteobacteria bacterium]
MSLIKSRKHATPSLRQLSPSMASLATSIALALPAAAMAADSIATGADEGYLVADAGNTTQLPTVPVEGNQAPAYKVDNLSSPKFVKPLVDTTQTIQIISSDIIRDQGATNLTEALRNSPGVGTFYVGENGNTATGDTVYLRGFDASSSIYVDGVRDLGSISRDVFNTDQVELTKGAAGTDNGRSSPSGAINLVSKQPMLEDAFSGSVALGTSSQKRITADLNKKFNSASGSAFRLNLMAQDSGVPGRDQLEQDRWGFAPSLAFGLAGSTRFYLNFLHVKQSNVPDGGVFTIGLPGYSSPDPARPELGLAPRVDSENFYGTNDDHDDVRADMFTARVEHDFNEDLKLQNTTRWGRTEQDYLLTSYRGNTENLLTPDINDPSTWTIARSIPTFKDHTNRILTNQTNLRLHSGSGSFENDFSGGLEFTHEKLDTIDKRILDGGSWPAASVYNPNPNVAAPLYGPSGAKGSGKSETLALYAFDTVTLNERWQLNAGVRLDRFDADFNSTLVCGTGGAPACGELAPGTIVPGVDESTSDTLFSWKVGALFKPAANGSVYANYSIVQQPPGGGSLELSSRPSSANNAIYDPQEAKTAEIGTKWELADNHLLLSAALYRTDISNEIVRDPVDLLYYQIGEKRVQGIELSAIGKITDAWSISAGYTTMDTEVIEGVAVSQDGSSELAYTPESAFTAWTTYQTPFNLTFGGGARYSGEMKRGTDGAVGTPEYTEAYWVFDAVVTYAFNEHLNLRLNAYNLFDKDYVTAINKSGYRYTPGMPRSWMLTADFRF